MAIAREVRVRQNIDFLRNVWRNIWRQIFERRNWSSFLIRSRDFSIYHIQKMILQKLPNILGRHVKAFDSTKRHLILAANIFFIYILTTNKLSFDSNDISCLYFRDTS